MLGLVLVSFANAHAAPISSFVANADQDYAGSVAYFAGMRDTIHSIGFAGKCVDYAEMPELDMLFDRFIGSMRRARDNKTVWNGPIVPNYAGFMAAKYGLKDTGTDGVCHYPDKE